LTKLMEMSQTKGSRTQSMGVSPSPSSSFSPFFKSPGAGGTRAGVSTLRNLTLFPLSTIISAIFIPLLAVMLTSAATNTGEIQKWMMTDSKFQWLKNSKAKRLNRLQ